MLRWLPLLLIAAAVLALLPMLYIGIYNHPCPADDFQNAGWRSFSGIQGELYRKWSGRYSGNLAASLCPLHWHSMKGYRLAVIGMIAAFALAYGATGAYGLRQYVRVPPRIAIAITAMAAALLFNNFPSLGEGFYWFSGEVTYVLPATAALCLMLLLLRVDGQEAPGGGALAGAGLLAAAAIGGNEIMVALCDLTVFGGWIYYRSRSCKAQSRFYGWLLIICGIFSAIALLAPGNFARQAVNPRSLVMVLPNWIYFSQKAFFQWITDPFLLLFSALSVLMLLSVPLRMRRVNLLTAFLLPLAIILLIGLPAHYALGKEPPPRVMNMLYTFFLLGWLLFLAQLTGVLRAGFAAADGGLKRQVAGVIGIVALLISANTHDLRQANVFIVSKSLTKGIPQAYDAEMRARYARIAAARGDTVGVPPVHYQAGNVLYVGDIIALKRATTNRHYAAYFGKGVVFIDSLLR